MSHLHDDAHDGGDDEDEAFTFVAAGGGSIQPAELAAAAVAPIEQPYLNKWSKNGFGEAVQKSVGKFSKEESELVRKAVEDYCAAKAISAARLCSECDHKAELKGAWMDIAKSLPHRSVQSVYRHGIRQLHPFKRGAWTDAECQMLMDLVARLGKKWSTVQSKLHRSADACRDKYREMSEDFVKGRWREPETLNLKRLIREHLHVDQSVDMKTLGKMVDAQKISIPWTLISKNMGKRSRLSCFKKWQKMTGLYSAADDDKRQRHGDKELDEDDQGGDAFLLGDEMPPPTKRSRRGSDDHETIPAPVATVATTITTTVNTFTAPTAGAAAAMAAAAAAAVTLHDYDDPTYYSAKMADETVEAVGLPDTESLRPADL